MHIAARWSMGFDENGSAIMGSVSQQSCLHKNPFGLLSFRYRDCRLERPSGESRARGHLACREVPAPRSLPVDVMPW